MALIKCPECDKDISNQTKSCPHCGYRLNAKKNKENVKLVFFILGIILFIALFAIIVDLCTTTTDEYAERLEKSVSEYNAISDRVDDLERQKSYNDHLIEYYEN